MKYEERLQRALKPEWNGDTLRYGDELDNLLQYAYRRGRETAAKEICDEHNQKMIAAREKARATRYHKMAESILPESDIIYSGDYAGDYGDMFGADEWKGA